MKRLIPYVLYEKLEYGTYYNLYNKIVKIIDIDYDFGNEIKIKYVFTDKNGVTRNDFYIASLKEAIEDFKPVDEYIQFKEEKIDNPSSKEEKMYDLVYQIGSKTIETIVYNKPKKMLYALKGFYEKDIKYKNGILIILPN
jgi:hypothetical protein